MPADIIYLDNAATTPTDSRVLAAMMEAAENCFGNASSVHAMGVKARAAAEEARAEVAALIGADPTEIVFTSGGTESDNAAVFGTAARAPEGRNEFVTTAIEHEAVLEAGKVLESRGFVVRLCPVDADGVVDLEELRKLVGERTFLVSIMHANNEVGSIQPIREAARIAKQAGAVFHTDAVQTVGQIPVDVEDLGVDLLSCSAHKLYGPKGVGFLYVRARTKLAPFLVGGGQEGGLRSSTLNVPGIVGMGTACRFAKEELSGRMCHLREMRDLLIEKLISGTDYAHLNGHPTERLPNNCNISFEFAEGESIVLTLDAMGICASAGSACAAGGTEPSHVLTAMGVPEDLARGAVRLTVGKDTDTAEVERAAEATLEAVARLRRMSPRYRAVAARQ
jgi:cysteine desulfurase